jgi:hypothetical protein
VLLLAASPTAAQQKPDFSGQWAFNKEKTRLAAAWAAGVERGTFRIVHREPAFRLERTFLLNGRESHASYELPTDGKPVDDIDTAADVKRSSRMYWEGDVLELSQRFEKTGLPEATNVVHYRLLEGGRVLQAVERVTGPAGVPLTRWRAEA